MKLSNRKKSHELNSIRNKYNTDEDRINKLTNFSMARQIEKQRNQQLSLTGREDPSNLVGYQQMRPRVATMRGGSNRRGPLDPLKKNEWVTAGEVIMSD